jgi:hypothetical protein
MARNRNELLTELEHAKQALIASEKRGRRSVRRLRALETALAPIVSRLELWANSRLSDSDNAPRLMTIGDCRKLLALLRDEKDPNDDPDDSVSNDVDSLP